MVHVLYIQLLILSKGFLLTFEKDTPLVIRIFKKLSVIINFLVTVNVSFIGHQQKSIIFSDKSLMLAGLKPDSRVSYYMT